MAQTHEGAMKTNAKKIGMTYEEYKEKQQQSLKRCTKCKQWKSFLEFGKDKSRWDGMQSRCYSCDRVKVRKDMKGRISPMKGKTHSEDAKLKMSQARIGNKNKLGKPLTAEQKKYLSQRMRECGNTTKGSRSARWKGGITPINKSWRNSVEAKDWRKAVFERDCYTCQSCGDSSGGNLNAHHIKHFASYPELRFDVNNGITLCEVCHKAAHYKPDSIRNRRKPIN